MYNSTNINVQNCTFQNSSGQSVVTLSEVSRNVNISNFRFSYNSHYDNHGTAIYCYASNDSAQLLLTINNCTFDYNDGASIVYFYHSGTSQEYSSLGYSRFNNNQGVSVFIFNQQLIINGLVLFTESNATCGAGLHVDDHASVIFTESSVVTSRLTVVSREAKKKQHAIASSGPRDHYSEYLHGWQL